MSCTYTGSACPRLKITNNIVAGAAWTGFTLYGHRCGGKPTNTGNVAHSINGIGGGYGFIILADPNDGGQGSCYQGSGLKAYKTKYHGFYSFLGTPKVIYTDNTIIDCFSGIGASIGGGNNNHVELKNNRVWGESPLPDCPRDGGFCFISSKCGFTSTVFVLGTMPIHPSMPSSRPFHKSKSYGAFGGTAIVRGNEFINFGSKTPEGRKNSIICILKTASDWIVPHSFIDNKLTNVGVGALAYIMHPPRGWANPSDCVEFPCTAPLNVIFDFRGTQYSSNPPFNYGSTF